MNLFKITYSSELSSDNYVVFYIIASNINKALDIYKECFLESSKLNIDKSYEFSYQDACEYIEKIIKLSTDIKAGLLYFVNVHCEDKLGNAGKASVFLNEKEDNKLLQFIHKEDRIEELKKYYTLSHII